MKILVCVMALGLGCQATLAKGGHPMPDNLVDVEVAVTRTTLGRPPLVRLEMAVSATNRRSHIQWLAIPTGLPPSRTGAGVASARILACGESRIVEFNGTGGFYLAILPPSGALALSGLKVGLWQSEGPVEEVEVPLTIADGLEIGGTPATAFLSTPGHDRLALDLAACTPVETRDLAGGREVPPRFDRPIVLTRRVQVPPPR